jgi:hypothetical protein
MRISTVRSLSTSRPSRREHAVVAVARVGIERDVGHHRQLRHGLLHGAHGAQHERILVQRLRALASLSLASSFGNSATAGTPSFAARGIPSRDRRD